MKTKPGSLIAQLLFAAFLLWLYGGDLVRWVRAQVADVTVMNQLPSLPLAIVGSLIALGFGFVVIASALKVQPTNWRPRRFSTIAAVSLIFFDFLVLSSRRPMMPAVELLVAAVNAVADAGSLAASTQSVARDPAIFEEALASFRDVPLFVKGERVAGWKVQLRESCSGPATELQSATPGTVIYCVSTDRKHAWVTIVATANGTTFGTPTIAGTDGVWLGTVEVARVREEQPGPPVWEEPTPDDAP